MTSTNDFVSALTRLARTGEQQRCGTFVFTMERGGHGFRTSRLGVIDEGIRYFPVNKTVLRRMAQSFADRDAPPSREPMMKSHEEE